MPARVDFRRSAQRSKWIPTSLNSQRNRPARLPEASPPPTGQAAALRTWFVAQLQLGQNPRRVGEQVVAAVREQRFYILTHPELNSLIQQRMSNILNSHNPTLQSLPFDSSPRSPRQ
jgi:hypothetical protein